MKNFKKILVLVLVLAMVFSLTACNKKAIDDKDFEDIMEDLDYEVYEGEGDKKVDTYMYAYDEDMEFYFTFEEYDDEEDAIDDFNDNVDDMKEVKEDGDLDGTIKVSGSGNFKKAVVKGDFDEDSDMFDGDVYAVMVRVDNILIYGYTDSTKDKDVDEINNVFKELGY